MFDPAITLQGYPEKVQRLPDAIEDAFPGLIIWVQSLDEIDDAVIKSKVLSIRRCLCIRRTRSLRDLMAQPQDLQSEILSPPIWTIGD